MQLPKIQTGSAVGFQFTGGDGYGLNCTIFIVRGYDISHLAERIAEIGL